MNAPRFPLALLLLVSACEVSLVVGRLGDADVNDADDAGDAGASSCTTPLTAKRVALGALHGCALLSDDSVRCWGEASTGQLGNADATARSVPVAIGAAGPFVALSASSYSACAVTSGGDVLCWGENFMGVLGTGGTANVFTPSPVTSGIASLAGGQSFVLARSSLGAVRVWGDATSGALGLGADAPTVVTSATPVPDVTFAAVTAGSNHACGLDASGRAHCSGSDAWGAIGLPGDATRDTFGLVSDALAFDVVDAGYDKTCAIATSGRLFCWGKNEPTVVVGATAGIDTPTVVGTDADWTVISAGFSHVCGLRSGGRLFCWGSNGRGELGLGDGEPRDVPTEVTPGVAYAAVEAGREVTCAIRAADAVVVCTGRNELGQLGRGTNDDASNLGSACLVP